MKKCIECGREEKFSKRLIGHHINLGYPLKDAGWYCPVCEY